MLVDRPEAALDHLDHQVANIGAVDAAGGANSGDRLAVAAIEREGDAHLFAIVAADLEPIRAPAGIGASDRNPSAMALFLPVSGNGFEQQAVISITGSPASRLPPLRPLRADDGTGEHGCAGSRTTTSFAATELLP